MLRSRRSAERWTIFRAERRMAARALERRRGGTGWDVLDLDLDRVLCCLDCRVLDLDLVLCSLGWRFSGWCLD